MLRAGFPACFSPPFYIFISSVAVAAQPLFFPSFFLASLVVDVEHDFAAFLLMPKAQPDVLRGEGNADEDNCARTFTAL